MDVFKARLQKQMIKGVHRHWFARRANEEYIEISLLVLTDPIDDQLEYWQLRGEILAYDCDSRRPLNIEARLN